MPYLVLFWSFMNVMELIWSSKRDLAVGRHQQIFYRPVKIRSQNGNHKKFEMSSL
jgi:hypothetical protein